MLRRAQELVQELGQDLVLRRAQELGQDLVLRRAQELGQDLVLRRAQELVQELVQKHRVLDILKDSGYLTEMTITFD